MAKRFPLLSLVLIVFICGCRYDIKRPLPTRVPIPISTPTPTPEVIDIHLLQKSDIEIDSDSDFFRALEGLLFVDIKIDTLSGHDYDRKLKIILSSQVNYDALSISPGMAQSFSSKFLDVTKDMKNYPNYYAWLMDNYRADTLLAFPISQSLRTVNSGWFLKQGSDILTGTYTIPGGVGGILRHTAPLFGIPGELMHKDGDYLYTPVMNEYRQVFMWLNSLYLEDRLDKDFFILRNSDWEYRIENQLFDITVADFDDWDIPLKAGYELINPPAELGMESSISSETLKAENFLAVLNTCDDPSP